jgi:hypothetical protein
MRFFVGVILLVATGLVACGESDDNDSATNAVTSVGTQQAAATPEVTPSPSPAPSPTPTPAPTPAPIQPLAVVSQGYGTGVGIGTLSVGYAFILENPNEQAADSVQYQVAAYDAAGVVLKTTSGSLPLVWPRQRVGVAGSLYMDQGQQISRLDVQVKPTKFEKFDTPMPFTTEGVTYRPDRYSPKVVGVVKSAAVKDVKSIQVFAVAYNAQNVIIGGGMTFLNFVPAGGSAAVEVQVNLSAEPARVELYPVMSFLSLAP